MKNHLGLLQLFYIGIRGWGPGVGIGWEEGHTRVEPIVGEERGQGGSRMFGVVVAELCQGEEAGQVCWLVVAVDSQVLVKD